MAAGELRLTPILAPDVNGLRMDDLLRELLERADHAVVKQRRLRELLAGVIAVGGDLDLATTLRRTVETARSLTSARYAALGVTGTGGRLAEFVHSGVPDAVAERLGDPPEGHGILGQLGTRSAPLRLAHLSAHPRSVGFPIGHPPMRSFLGVPIGLDGDVFGSLYVTEKTSGAEFTEDDEESMATLATAAAAAIGNARRFAAACRSGAAGS